MVDRLDESLESAEVAASADLRDARPRVDPLAMERARARAEAALFGSAPPAKLGRYVLLGKSGDGGMGVVYAAYDPDLHRKVALKVLHPTRQQHDRAHERLISEARALAKLDHPNVVKVHDVITHDSEVVIVMEWVEGVTLEEWSRTAERSWREVVAVYIQAAEGLAAAHSVGVIHRDFKPSNAILGTDGRVRVLDFGLARAGLPAPAPPDAISATSTASAAAPPPASGSSPSPSTSDAPSATGALDWADIESPVVAPWPSLTATGVLVGTLAYASPEQLCGEDATAASDQFSFGVSLHRALEGVAPFTGNDPTSRAKAIESGALALAPDRAIPPWLRALVSRCLSYDAAARFSSIGVVLVELRRARGLRRATRFVAVGLLVAMAGTTVAAVRAASSSQFDCATSDTGAEQLWNPAVRQQIIAALHASRAPGEDEITARVLTNLDSYIARWDAEYRHACTANQRHEESDQLHDRRVHCLQNALSEFRASVQALSRIDSRSAADAPMAVPSTSNLAACSNVIALQGAMPPPTDPEAVRRIQALQFDLNLATAADKLGRIDEFADSAARLAQRATALGYCPLTTHALMLHGRALMIRRQFRDASAVYAEAWGAGSRCHESALAIEAEARKVFTDSMRHPDLATLQRDIELVGPLAEMLPDDHFARPLFLNNIGTAFMALEDRQRAMSYFLQAEAAIGNTSDIDPELYAIDQNIAMLTPDASVREKLTLDVWQRLRARFGDTSILTLDALTTYATYIRDPERAIPLLERANSLYTRHHPTLAWTQIFYDSYLAYLYRRVGRSPDAMRVFDRILARAAAAQLENEFVMLARAWSALLRHDTDTATLYFKLVVGATAASPDWWRRLRVADANVGIASTARLTGNLEMASGRDADAAAIYKHTSDLTEEAEFHLKYADASR